MNLIMSNAQETLRLIERCIAMKEDRVLRCGNNDPWGYSSMCAAFGLLETHMGIKTSEAAKASAAERFISLHYKLLAFQIPPFPNPSHTTSPHSAQDPISRAKVSKDTCSFVPGDQIANGHLSPSPHSRWTRRPLCRWQIRHISHVTACRSRCRG